MSWLLAIAGFAMLVVLPMRDDGLPQLERRLSAENLAKWVAALEQRTVDVELPKFRAESSIDLEPHLAALGMATAFDRMRADFTGMSTTQPFEDQLFLAKALHKSFVEVNEKGSEAAAATGMALAIRGSVRPFVPKFAADHPFVYLIRDTRTGTVLFLGRKVDA